MTKSTALLLFSLIFTLQAQEFIPHGELLQPGHAKYVSSKKIETQKSGFYLTAKDGIPAGKATAKTFTRFSPKGQPLAVTFSDSTGTSIDSFYYDKAGSVERIVTFRGNTDSSAVPVNRWYFKRDSTGKMLEVHLYDLASAAISETWRYFHGKTGKLTSIARTFTTDSTATDSLRWEFDKNEKLAASINGAKRTEYKYDQGGNLSEAKEFTGKTAGNTTKYAYDNNRQLTKVTTSGKGYNSVSEYLYNKNGVLILIKTKTDKGVKGSETYSTELREVTFYK